jgi:S-formylglutathione hydrolase
MNELSIVEEHLCFGGRQIRFRHVSSRLQCAMHVSVFLPPQALHHSVPALYWLSGLTCTDENFTTKAGAQQIAAQLGLALIMPDTSPRGVDVHGQTIPDDPAYDLGQGAGFYVNATQQPWQQHYQMYDYIVEELPELLERELPLSQKRAISGHSMGGHGALVIGLRNPLRYSSISALAPIVHPTEVPWGQKALTAYLGDKAGHWPEWHQYDAHLLLSAHGSALPILIDQGQADPFLAEQLQSDTLLAVAQQTDLRYRLHAGYDHSYYFIASFIEEHLRFHAAYLS